MPRSWLDTQQARRRPVITVAPYALLAVLLIVTVIIKHSAVGSLVIDVALCASAAVWMLWLFTLHPAWRDHTGLMAVFFTGLMAIMAVLVLRDPWFGCFMPVAYVYAFRLLPWPWMLPGAAAVALMAGTAQAYSIDKATFVGLMTYLAILAVNVLPMSGFAWFTRRAAQQSDQRNQALVEVSDANRRLAATLAENAGLHQQLLSQARAAGMLDERQRMAREIHDTLAQGLTGIITQLQAAEQAEQEPSEWRRHVAAATRLARDSLAEARRSVHALRPRELETARLSDAVAEVAERWSALHGIPVGVTTTGTARPMRTTTEAALLRTAQEALANVAKHARASRVGVTLSYMDHQVALDVRDDGSGFDPEAAPAGTNGDGGGFGLVAMRQRIEGLAGTLQIESEPGGGTGISACVPADEVRE
jgi:signal transduction histidine kinase